MSDMFLDNNAEVIENTLHDKGYNYLKTRVYRNTIVIYSEYDRIKENRFRLIHDTDKSYVLSMATHTGKWELTAFEGTIEELLTIVINDFNWILTNYSD
jgi:hypothetical protein